MAWLEEKLEGSLARAAPEPLLVYSLSPPTCLTCFEKINRSVCLRVSLLVSSLVQGFAVDLGSSYKL